MVLWSWDEVARKRALKNVLNRAYPMPSLEQLAKESWIVDGVETLPEDWAAPEVYATVGEAERHAQLATQQRERQEKVDGMDVEERAAYVQSTKAATDTMRDNGDDDPLGEQPPLNPGMKASSKFWEFVYAQKLSREEGGQYLQKADGDFDKALDLMKEAQA
jgi:hypothetical protein